MNSIISDLKKYETVGMRNQLPLVWSNAMGDYVYDEYGKRHIDFSCGIFVTNIGHSNRDWYNAILAELADGVWYSYSFPTKIRAKFLKKLIEITPSFCEKASLFSAGTEATEAAVKLMRLNRPERIIVSISGSMHGKTMLAEHLKRNGEGWAGFNEYVYNLPYPNQYQDFKLRFAPDEICGFIIESYQGWSARFLPDKYIKSLVEYAKENNIPVCFDEIQAGFGRTGKLFAFEHYGVEPDLICLGKGLSGGMPLSAVVGRKELIDLSKDMSSTNSGHPICCAAALENIKIIEKNKLVEKSEASGKILRENLSKLLRENKEIVEINSLGLVGAIIFDSEKTATQVCLTALEEGLILVYTGRESLKIGPPLNISQNNLKKGLDILEKSIKMVSNGYISSKKIISQI